MVQKTLLCDVKKVGIIGCGWLGFELAKSLLNSGYEVRGTTTTIEKNNKLEQAGIQSHVFMLGTKFPANFLNDLSVLVISFPMKSTIEFESLNQFVVDLKNNISASTQVIFTSSISVYNDDFSIHDVDSVHLNPENKNLKFERSLQAQLSNSILILRLGGLISEDRHPIRFMAGRSNLKNGNAPVNLVHRTDIIRFIELCFLESVSSGVYNLVYPDHPSKSEYYKLKANEYKLPIPSFERSMEHGKLIKSTIFINGTEFDYRYKI